MIRINLLPYRAARKKENIRRQIGIFFLSLLVVVAILLFYDMRLQKQIDVLNANIAENKTMLAKFESLGQCFHILCPWAPYYGCPEL